MIKSITLLFTAISIVTTSLSVNKAFAWGDTGHRIVGQIAESELSDSAKEKLKKILGDETLAEASTWADDVRSDANYKFQDDWHFVTIPDGIDYEASAKNPNGDIITAIQKMSDVLLDKKSTQAEKVRAVRLIAHFVGDIHQPHHVGNDKDRGANWCYVKLFGSSTNLHAVWDSGLIGSNNLSYTEYAKHINKKSKASNSVRDGWKNETLMTWAKESQAARNALYPLSVDGSNNRTYCKGNDSDRIPPELVPSLSYDYRFQFKETMEDRMLRAGVRLAGLLNRLLD